MNSDSQDLIQAAHMHTYNLTCSRPSSGGTQMFICLPQVCHHPDCQDLNSKSPLHLCESCDTRYHPNETTNMHFDRHPRFDLQLQSSILARNVSTRSCPPRTSPQSDLDEEEEAVTERGERKVGPMKIKKKPPRRYTDEHGKECFTLKFDLNIDIDTEIVPAVKKKTLREVLGPVFERKGIELSRVHLFLDQSNTPLPLDFDSIPFGGRYLKVKARPGEKLKMEREVKDFHSFSLPNMKNSDGPYILSALEKVEHGSLPRRESVDILGPTRRRKNMNQFLGDANIPSPDSLAQLGGSLSSLPPGIDSRKKGIRISGFFFPPSKDVEKLNDKLQMYSYKGLPKMSFYQDSWEEEEPDLTLEQSWTRLLQNPETLSRRQFQQQEAIWELLQTEATYIKQLKVITDLFLCGLLDLKDCGLLNEVEPTKLFNNMQDLVRVHTALWTKVMVPALENARQKQSLLDPTDLLEGFQNFPDRFQPYLRYCMEEESCIEYMRSQLRENELFSNYIKWAEGDKQCNRLKLADMLVKPHQRLTKYPLLLKTILKKTDEPAAREALLSMVERVESFINGVDAQMLQRQEQQKLTAISARVESYEAVEGGSEEVERILKEFNHIDLMAPMIDTSPKETRQLHLEGALRMKEGKDSRMDVYCFLFTDLLLIAKPVKRLEKVKVIRQPLLLHNVVCKELKDPGSFVLIYLNELKSAVAAYSFQANSASQGRSWIDAVCSVQNQLQRLRSEEAQRQQATIKREAEKEEEEDVVEQSSTSTNSSPRLASKEHHDGSSDGSTETLSVMETEESIVGSDLHTDPELDPSALPDRAPEQSELEPQCRSLSLESAYGTLSPESLLDLQSQSANSEEESTEESTEGSTEGDSVEMLTNQEEKEEDEKEDKLHERNTSGSGLSVAAHLKPRRRAPVQSRLHCLRRLAHKSHSEDNLLQIIHGEDKQGAGQDDVQVSDTLHSYQLGLQWDEMEGLTHSKSLNELRRASTGSSGHRERERADSEQLMCSLPAYVLRDTLWRATTKDKRPTTAGSSNSDGQLVTGGYQKGKSKTLDGDSRRQPHKKLTLAQLCRIRTTLVLNSTLTASEV